MITTPEGRRGLEALTGLRFPAALLVAIYHFGLPYWSTGHPWLGTIFGHGFTAVNLFFFLSGFILTLLYVGQDRLGPGRRGAYVVARVARLYPLYLFSLVPTALVGLWAGVPLVAIVAQLALLQAWFPMQHVVVSSGNFPAWSLSVELLCYMLFPLLPFARCRRLSPTALAATGVAVYMGAMGLLYGLMRLPGLEKGWHSLLVFFPPLHVPVFLAGVLAGLYCLARPPASTRRGRLVAWGLPELSLIATFAAIVAARRWLPGSDVLLKDGLLTPCFALLVVGLSAGISPLARLLAHPICALLGRASYAVYLLHVPLWFALRHLNAREALGALPAPIYFGVYMVLLTGISIGAYMMVEQPMREWIQRRYRMHHAREAPLREAA